MMLGIEAIKGVRRSPLPVGKTTGDTPIYRMKDL